jgi:4-hydroxy-2-oxoheptanedioate aldolase
MDLPRNAFRPRSPAASSRSGCGAACAARSSPRSSARAASTGSWSTPSTRRTSRRPCSPSSRPAGRHRDADRAPGLNDPVLLKRLLDIGTQAVLVPFVQNAEEAAKAVAACRYPPAGIRGITVSGRGSRYGRVPDYLKRADAEICVLVQVETGEALAQLEAIASVDGVDGVFIGPRRSLGIARPYRQSRPSRGASRDQGRSRSPDGNRQAGRHPDAVRGRCAPLYRMGLSLRRCRL